MKFAIFTAIVSFAFLANGAVLPNKQDVTTQEINKVISDLLKNQIDEYAARQPMPANFGRFPIKTENIDVLVEFKDGGHQVLGKVTSQSQSTSLTDSKVSAGFLLTFQGLFYVGSAQIKGTINKKPVDLKGHINMVAPDLTLELDIEAKHDAKSVEIVDLTFPLSKNFNPIITLSEVQIEETEKLEKAIEDALKKQLDDAQKAVDEGKPQTIAHLNEVVKGKTLRDLIDMLSSNIPSMQIKTLLGF